MVDAPETLYQMVRESLGRRYGWDVEESVVQDGEQVTADSRLGTVTAYEGPDADGVEFTYEVDVNTDMEYITAGRMDWIEERLQSILVEEDVGVESDLREGAYSFTLTGEFTGFQDLAVQLDDVAFVDRLVSTYVFPYEDAA